MLPGPLAAPPCRIARIACLALALSATAPLGGCATRRPYPAPLDEPEEVEMPRPSTPPPQRRPEHIEEEPLGSEAEMPGYPAPPAEDALAAAPPSLLPTITPATAPNVAAATRLVEEARGRLDAQDIDAALERLERALAIDPSSPYAYYFLAEAHRARRSYDQAIVFAEKAAQLSSRLGSEWVSRAQCLQGEVYENAGRFADARAAYQRSLESDRRNRAAFDALTRLGVPAGSP